MNLTLSQQQILKDYLSNELVYRETYNELYDHISSGLENTPEGSSFEETLKNYVRKEFGGIFGLHAIEKQYRSTVLKGMKRQYFDNISRLFRFPQIILLSIVTVMVYLAFSASWFNANWYFALFFVAAFAITGIRAARYISSGFWKKKMPSVKDDGFVMIKFFPFALFVLIGLYGYFVLGNTSRELFNTFSPVVTTVIFIAYALHIMSFYKMYRSEFKVNMAK